MNKKLNNLIIIEIVMIILMSIIVFGFSNISRSQNNNSTPISEKKNLNSIEITNKNIFNNNNILLDK